MARGLAVSSSLSGPHSSFKNEYDVGNTPVQNKQIADSYICVDEKKINVTFELARPWPHLLLRGVAPFSSEYEWGYNNTMIVCTLLLLSLILYMYNAEHRTQ